VRREAAFRFLINRMSAPIPASWLGLTRLSRKTLGISSDNWMAGSGPAMTGERKFANVFKASFEREHPGNQVPIRPTTKQKLEHTAFIGTRTSSTFPSLSISD
jgi:hypothetical protein